MMFVRAEREGDWRLHLASFRKIVPYFFASEHVNYARYGLIYLREMEKLPEEVFSCFMKGEHVMRHSAGLWNGIWSDMMIETTFMQYGHSSGGLIGITLKPETVKVWALSLHSCSRLESDLDNMFDVHTQNQVMTTHKEEGRARIFEDNKDRQQIRDAIDACIHPLQSDTHPSCVVNIFNGQISPPEVNVQNAVEIRTGQMKYFESSLPEGFYQTISKKVVTMANSRKHVNIRSEKVFDCNLIYSRLIGLLVNGRDIKIEDVIRYELAPVPTSTFDDNGNMRIAKSKSTLKQILQVETPSETPSNADISILDGSAILWVVHWPTDGTVQYYIENFKNVIGKRLQYQYVYIVFDRYYDCSPKSITRK